MWAVKKKKKYQKIKTMSIISLPVSKYSKLFKLLCVGNKKKKKKKKGRPSDKLTNAA